MTPWLIAIPICLAIGIGSVRAEFKAFQHHVRNLTKLQTSIKDFRGELQTIIEPNESLLKTQKYYIQVPIQVTAYPPLRKYTDDTPTITASGTKVNSKTLALSSDLERKLKLPFGATVHLAGIGEYKFLDRMNPRWTRKADVLKWTESECRTFGIKNTKLIVEKKIKQ